MHRNNSYDIDTLAELSKLIFSEDEKIVLEKEMKAFFDMADKLNEIPEENFQAVTHVETMTNVFRADCVSSDFTAEEMLSGAKTKADGYITVPRVVEG